jgi:predicted acylesterase/phospholipase RssA
MSLIIQSVDECIEKYMKLSEKVFDRDQVLFGVLPTGEKSCRFDSSVLEQAVKDLVKEKLKDENAIMAETRSHKPCPAFVVATSAAVAQGPPILFRSYNSPENNADKCPIWKAARATSAAPSFFDPMFIDIPAPGEWYVDGGLRYNNPSQLALEEAREIWPRVKRFSVVSIGTGRQSNVEFVNIKDVQPPKEPESGKGFLSGIMGNVPGSGIVGTIMNVPGAAKELANIGKACVEMSTSSAPVHEAMFKLAHNADLQSCFPYYRFNVENGMDVIGLEEWKYNVRIGELTRQYMREGGPRVERTACVRYLLRPAPVECT